MKKHLLTILIAAIFSVAGTSQVLVDEDFNGTLPADWSISTNASDGGWIIGNPSTIASQFWPVGASPDGTTFIATNDDACNCDKSEDRLILPTLDLSGVTGALFMNFDIAYAQGNYGVDESLFIEVSYDGGATWEVISEITGDGSIVWRNAVYNVSEAAGNASVNFAFRYNDGGGWLFGAALDNVVLRVPNGNDVRLELDDIYQFADVSGPVNITGSVTNVGGEPLTSFDVTINDGSGPVTESITGVNIMPLESATFEVPINLPAPTTYNITVDIANPNGMADEDVSNNTGGTSLTGVTNAPAKMVFVEESTGTWCPWCPRGAVFMDLMEETYAETFAGVAVHVGLPQQGWPDPMEVPDYAAEYNQLVSGYPTLVIDRISNPGIPGIDEMLGFGQELSDYTKSRPSPIGMSVDAEINEFTREMEIDLEVTAHSNIAANYSVAVLITEDHVTGDAFDYRQANNYAGGGQGPMGGWENLGNPASGANIEYNHTLRDAIGGFYGDPTLIPAMIAAGETYNHQISYTIPDEWNMEELNIVAIMLDRGNEDAVYNAAVARDIRFMVSSVSEIEGLNAFDVFPNPVADHINVSLEFDENMEYDLEILDLAGKSIRDLGHFSGPAFRESFNVSELSAGMYFITVKTKDGLNVLKFNKI